MVCNQKLTAMMLMWLTTPFQRSGEEAFRGSEIAPLAESELDRIAFAVSHAVQIHLPALDFDVGIVDMPFLADRPLATLEWSRDQRRCRARLSSPQGRAGYERDTTGRRAGLSSDQNTAPSVTSIRAQCPQF